MFASLIEPLRGSIWSFALPQNCTRVGGRCSLSRIAAQSTEGLLETKKSATKSQVRDNFSAILNLMFFAVFCMAENLSRTKFD